MAKKSQKKKQGVALPEIRLPKVDFAGMIDGVKARFSGNRPEKPLTKAERRHKARVRRVAWRVTLSVLTVIGVILVAALAAGWAAFRGPSPSTGDLLTMSMLETSALKFVPRLYYSASEMDAIIARNAVDTGDSETDTSLIVIAKPTPTPDVDAAIEAAATPVATAPPENLLLSEDGIDVFQVQGGTYKGFMMVVYDPSRVTCGTCRDTFTRQKGLQLKDIAKRYDAIAAINGGGFEDSGGVGNGGTPVGLVISEGKLKHTGRDRNYDITVGFDQNNIMVLGKNMSADDAKAKGIRDAITFGPALIVNGEPAGIKGESSGLNPRTAIGQRKDGAVLMLVIDGRQASSLGATYSDLISIINMDGGSSSLMYYQGEYLNSGVVLTGSRKMPTAFIVR